MNNLNEQVQSKISDIIFQDGKKLIDFISNVVIKENNVGFSIDLEDRTIEEGDLVRSAAQEKLSRIHGIGKITIILTSRHNINRQNKPAPAAKVKHYIDGIKKVILVAAGKGGVGKSTIAATLAEQLQIAGKRIGLVDADIYGPSIPQMFGINEMPKIIDKKMIPLSSRDIQINSIGFLTKGDVVAWRGPMASKAIYQLLSVTSWDNLDYLIIDMPPGTGDIHLSILENYHINGVIMVTTPQKIAGIDVRKAIDLYKKFDLPILGIIENMSYFIDSNNNKVTIFGGESGENLAKKYNIPLIAKLPLIPELSKYCDEGKSLATLVNLPLEHFL